MKDIRSILCIFVLHFLVLHTQGSDEPEDTSSLSSAVQHGDPDCPCIDSSSILETTSNCVIDASTTAHNTTNSTSIPGILVRWNGGAVCYPLEYGSNRCATHDWNVDPLCSDDNPNRPDYCDNPWCYVDYNQCRTSNQFMYKSTDLFLGNDDLQLFYSYSTCNSSADDWLTHDTTRVFEHNKTLKVIIPAIDGPRHWKMDDNGQEVDRDGPEYYDDGHPYIGWAIDYFQALLQHSNIRNVQFVHRSKASARKGYASAWTQAVTDIEAGIGDMALSSFWATSERLAIAPFTVPIAMDRFKLWIPQPELQDGSLQDNARKVLLPFSTDLWIAILATIVLFGVLTAIISPRLFAVHNHATKQQQSPTEKVVAVSKTVVRSITAGCFGFLGGGVEYSPEANVSQRLLTFGFAIFIFIVVTAYTANLAAFLTLSGASQYLSSIDQAIGANLPLCSHTNVEGDLRELYPNANWVFLVDYPDIVEAFDQGRCKALVLGWVGIRGDPERQQMLCERNLVRVGPSIMDKPMAFPANKDIVAGLSHWISVASTAGVTWDSFLEQQESRCNLDIVLGDEGSDDLQQLTPINLVLPLTIFAVCGILAVGIRAYQSLTSSRKLLLAPRPRNTQRDDALNSSCCSEEMDRGEQGLESALRPVGSASSVVDHGLVAEKLEDTMLQLLKSQEALLSRIQSLDEKAAQERTRRRGSGGTTSSVLG